MSWQCGHSMRYKQFVALNLVLPTTLTGCLSTFPNRGCTCVLPEAGLRRSVVVFLSHSRAALQFRVRILVPAVQAVVELIAEVEQEL